MATWIDQLKADLRADESLALFAYPDPLSPMGKRLGRIGIERCARTGYIPSNEHTKLNEGKPWTIGYGCAQPWVNFGTTIAPEVAEALLDRQVAAAIEDAKKLIGPPWDQLNGVRKAVVANMSFNLGYAKLSEFKRTIKAIQELNFKDAALFMSQSLWANQVKARAVRLIKQMNSGKLETK